MIEAISCTQTEFLLVLFMEDYKNNSEFWTSGRCFDMSVIIFACFTITILGSGVSGGLFLAH